MQKKIRIGITQGDINSISYELIIKTFIDNRILNFCTPIVYGSPKVASYYRKALDIQNFSFNTIRNISEINEKKANLINCVDDNIRVELGKASEVGAEAGLRAMEFATKDLMSGNIDAIITCPMNYEMAKKIEPDCNSNKDYLLKTLNGKDSMLMFINDQIKVGMVSEQVPFENILSNITEDNIINKLKILNTSLQKDFSIRKPKIAVLSLNPNQANLQIGKQEKEIIMPAIKKANKEHNILAIGTFFADTFFKYENMNKFDAVLAMYYEQGITPLKATNFGGATYFAGFQGIIIEPNFDLSYDIAGMNKATEDSLREAVYKAKDIFDNRKLHKNLTKNPLDHIDMDKE